MIPQRISVVRNGQFEPLYPDADGPVSPSQSFPIEAHQIRKGHVSEHASTGQVLTFFTADTAVVHSSEGRRAQLIAIPKDSVVVSLRGEPERVQWLEDASILTIGLDDQVLSAASEALRGRPEIALVPNPGLQDTRFIALFEALRIERAAGFPSGHLFVDGIEQAFSALVVSHLSEDASCRSLSKGGMSPKTARRVADYIADNLSSDMSVSLLASIGAVSPSHFCRSFRITFNTTPHEFVTAARIQKAKDLLRRKDHSLLDIAQLCGFRTQQHFSRVFAHRVGLPPGRYRELL